MTDGSTDLSLATMDELLEEVKNRCIGGVCVVAYMDRDTEMFRELSWGSAFWRRGIMETVCGHMAEVCDRIVRQTGDPRAIGNDDEADDTVDLDDEEDSR